MTVSRNSDILLWKDEMRFSKYIPKAKAENRKLLKKYKKFFLLLEQISKMCDIKIEIRIKYRVNIHILLRNYVNELNLQISYVIPYL